MIFIVFHFITKQIEIFKVNRRWNTKYCIDCIDLIDFWCFNATFSNISAISWRPVLVVEEA
jgi:hypothetical protein